METPFKFQEQILHADVEDIHSQFQHFNNRKVNITSEAKKSSFLTPLLLAIPVIAILIILISRSISDVSTTASEPAQHEMVQTKKAVALP